MDGANGEIPQKGTKSSMRIILKPLGAITLIGVILLLTVLLMVTLRAQQTRASGSMGATGTTDRGAWSIDPNAGTVERTSLGLATPEMRLPASLVHLDAGADTGSFTATVSCTALGTTSQFPKYGLLIVGQRPGDRIEAWLDPPNSCLATRRYVAGNERAWRNSPLPAGFQKDKDHVLRIRWRDHGRIVTTTVDDDAAGMQEDSLPSEFQAAGFGVLSEDAIATYRNIQIDSTTEK